MALSDALRRAASWLERQTSFPDLSAAYQLQKLEMTICTFDIDGVVSITDEIGIYPGPRDHIITGRSYEERPETERMLLRRGIKNRVHYNALKFDQKTRKSSGEHKAATIKRLQAAGYMVKAHFEDDEIQAAVIRAACPDVPVVHLVHDLTEKENVRRDGPKTAAK